jgi:uncharacterized membrane protein YeaQ/YmgE (transglycosylase-associated protein family)
MSFNPYSVPTAKLEFTGHDAMSAKGCWRIGKDLLYVSSGADLPDRCVKCNGPAQRPTKQRKFYWHSSWLYLLILLHMLLYIIVALFKRKKVILSPALCTQHANKRRNLLLGAWGAFGAGLVISFIAIGNGNIATAAICFFVGLVGAIVAVMLARIVFPVGIDDRGARFKGCGAAFLESLESNRPY